MMEESSTASLSSSCSMNVTQNPFDTDSVDSLHLPQCSPSVFAIKQKSTPASSVKVCDKKGFFVVYLHSSQFSEQKNILEQGSCSHGKP